MREQSSTLFILFFVLASVSPIYFGEVKVVSASDFGVCELYHDMHECSESANNPSKSSQEEVEKVTKVIFGPCELNLCNFSDIFKKKSAIVNPELAQGYHREIFIPPIS